MFCNFLVTMVPLKSGKNYMLSTTNFIIHDHHLIKGLRVITLDKITSIEIYSVLISKIQNKPSSNAYLENLFND